MQYDCSVVALSQALPWKQKVGSAGCLPRFPSPLCSLGSRFLLRATKRTYPHTEGLPALLSRQTNSFWNQKEHEQDGLPPAICLTEARKLSLGVCIRVACWRLLSIFPHVLCRRAASVGCLESPPHTSRKHPRYPHAASIGCTLRGHANILCLWGEILQSGLTTNQASLARQQGQVAKPQLPSPLPPTQPLPRLPHQSSLSDFFFLSPVAKNNFLLECLSLSVTSPTFLGMSGEQFLHCSRMRL